MKFLHNSIVVSCSLMFCFSVRTEASIISCINGTDADGKACESCGENCNWTFDTESGKLNISGSGKMNDYSGYWDEENKVYVSDTPWSEYKRKIKSVDVQGVSNIGNRAFFGSNGSLESCNIADTVTDIGKGAFYSANLKNIVLPESLENLRESAFEYSGLISAIVPDSVKNMDGRVFAYNGGLVSVVIPDTLTEIKPWGTLGLDYNNIQIICKGTESSCARLASKVEGLGYNMDNFVTADAQYCTGSYIYDENGCHKRNENQCNDTENYYYNGKTCVYRPSSGEIKCENSGFYAGYGYCYRVRYTMEEANSATSDDTENMIEWIFE